MSNIDPINDNDIFKSDVGESLATIRNTLQACFDQGWNITQLQYTTIKKHNNIIADMGTDEQKKQHCRLLYEARTRQPQNTPKARYYTNLEAHFRELCNPLLNLDTSFKNEPFNLKLFMANSSLMSERPHCR